MYSNNNHTDPGSGVMGDHGGAVNVARVTNQTRRKLISKGISPSPSAPLVERDRPPAKRLILWKDGVPTVATQPATLKESLSDVMLGAMLQPYRDDLGLYPEYAGLSNMEVASLQAANMAAEGDLQAFTALLNRILGMPKQSSESKTLTMNYQDFLNAVALREAEKKNITPPNLDAELA